MCGNRSGHVLRKQFTFIESICLMNNTMTNASVLAKREAACYKGDAIASQETRAPDTCHPWEACAGVLCRWVRMHHSEICPLHHLKYRLFRRMAELPGQLPMPHRTGTCLVILPCVRIVALPQHSEDNHGLSPKRSAVAICLRPRRPVHSRVRSPKPVQLLDGIIP